jgi:RHS repeat-associated protein
LRPRSAGAGFLPPFGIAELRAQKLAAPAINGNTLTKTVGSNTTTYAWDYENRLTSATLPGTGGTVTFKYDPFGRRIEKVSPTFTSIFAYDGDNLVETTNSSGGVVARYTQTQNIDEPLAELRSSGTSYYEADGLGSITSLTSAAGAVANSYTYDSYGNLTASSGSVSNPFSYTGREFDTETGLYYYRDRYYDQASGRFISEDPARFGGGATFYEYTGNDPTLFVDPTGDCPLNLEKFVKWLDDHAYPKPTEWCSRQIRLGLENGAGANTAGAPIAAKDWGPFLTNHLGFSTLPQNSPYSPQVGDIAVFQPANGSNANGHVEAWDGTQWVSDYKQGPPLPNGTHFYPNLKKYGPQPYVIYRCN